MEVYLRVPLPIYGSLWIIAIAYVIRFMPYGMRYVYSGVLQLHRELEEAEGAGVRRHPARNGVARAAISSARSQLMQNRARGRMACRTSFTRASISSTNFA